jgi:hypothetical protein
MNAFWLVPGEEWLVVPVISLLARGNRHRNRVFFEWSRIVNR